MPVWKNAKVVGVCFIQGCENVTLKIERVL